DVAVHLPSPDLPEFAKQVGPDDGHGSGVENEAVALRVGHAPAGSVARFDERRCHARRLQSDRQRESAKTGPDHAGAFVVAHDFALGSAPHTSKTSAACVQTEL